MENNIITQIKRFKEWFSGHENNFVIIGGAACSLIMNERGADFRMTKDVDMVLLLEVMDVDFGTRFWEYVIKAGYEHCQKSTGKPQYYRFYKPISSAYPEMIELFSRRVDGFPLPDNAVITPIPISEDVSSLSAILLNDNYYRLLREGVRKIDGLPILDEIHMIPFKAKAWLDLTEKRSKGERIDRSDINKHRRDIYRLADMVVDGFKCTLPEAIAKDMDTYLKMMQELLDNLPQKERKADSLRLKKIKEFYFTQSL